MKALAFGLAIAFALALAGCSAGIYAGSASFDPTPHRQTLCTHSYTGHLSVPDSPDNGLQENRQCVITPGYQDGDY